MMLRQVTLLCLAHLSQLKFEPLQSSCTTFYFCLGCCHCQTYVMYFYLGRCWKQSIKHHFWTELRADAMLLKSI